MIAELLRHWIYLFVLIPALQFPGHREDAPSAIPPEAAAAFGRLPVRFNDRMTNLDHVACCYLRRISGDDKYLDASGRPGPAATLFLDVAIHTERLAKEPIVLIDSPETWKWLGIAPRADAHISYNELSTHLHSLTEQVAQADRKPSSARTSGELALDRLEWRVEALIRAAQAFGTLNPEGSVLEVVPPGDAGARWLPFYPAALTIADPKHDSALKGNIVRAYARVLNDYQNGNGKSFGKDVANLGQLTAGAGGDCPIGYDAPTGMVELGVPYENQPHFYPDTDGVGRNILQFERFDTSGWSEIRMDYFSGPIASFERIVNRWRFGHGLMPLDRDELVKTIESIRVVNAACPLAQFTTADAVARAPAEAVSVLIQREGRSFMVSVVSSPPGKKAAREALIAFARSMKIGDAKSLDAWFPPAPREPMPPSRALIALVRDGQRYWCLRLCGSPHDVAAQQQQFEAWLASISFQEAAGVAPIQWKLPPGWTQEATPQSNFASGKVAGVDEFIVDVVDAGDHDSLAALLNTIRDQHHLPPLDKEALLKTLSPQPVGGRHAVRMDLEYPGGSAKF